MEPRLDTGRLIHLKGPRTVDTGSVVTQRSCQWTTVRGELQVHVELPKCSHVKPLALARAVLVVISN